MKAERKIKCFLCGSDDIINFIKMKDMPVEQQFLFPDYSQAVNCSKGEIELLVCKNCTIIWNKSFNPDIIDYSAPYEASQVCSQKFRQYVEKIAERLVKKYDIFNKRVVEIGSGDGFLLQTICRIGNNEGIGFEPSAKQNEIRIEGRITIIADFFSSKFRLEPDIIICRHVLEHIHNPIDFLDEIREVAKDDTILFFEVPNFYYSLDNLLFYDIYYEHCLYFNEFSMYYLFRKCRFNPINIKLGFQKQYILLEAKKGKDSSKLDRVYNKTWKKRFLGSVQKFKGSYEKYISRLREIRESLKNYTIVFWTAGARTVTLLNIMKWDTDYVKFVVDINPKKQGNFIPGTGQKIISPHEMKSLSSPLAIFLPNPAYLSEIKDILKQLKLKAKIILTNKI